MHAGVTKYHHIGLLVPVIVAILPYYLGQFITNETFSAVPRSLVMGATVTAISYAALSFIPGVKDDTYVLNKAVLLGLLTSEVCIFSVPDQMPSIVLIVFFVFMYLFGIAEVH